MLLTAFGLQAQYNAGTGSGTSGTYHTFVGDYAGRINTGTNNSFFGRNAGYDNTSGRYNTFIGATAGRYNTTGTHNSFFGRSAGYRNTTAKFNVFLGANAGYNNNASYNTFVGEGAGTFNTIGIYNTFMGRRAGYNNTEGIYNSFIGAHAGYVNTTGSRNTAVGLSAGRYNTTGSSNTFLGSQAGHSVTTSHRNTMIGDRAGFNATGTDNIFLGHQAGYNETGSDKLYIDNSSTSSPLIHGDFSTDLITINGKMRIGTVNTPNGYKLYVGEGILTEKVKVATHGTAQWADYVFEPDYDLNSLEEVENFIQTNKHLPNVPSEEEVNKDGVDMVEMDATLLRQIEELWLHTIKLNERIQELEAQLDK